MSNSAHASNGNSTRWQRRQSKVGQTISLERLEELLGKRDPLPEALAEPKMKRSHDGLGWKPAVATTLTRGETT